MHKVPLSSEKARNETAKARNVGGGGLRDLIPAGHTYPTRSFSGSPSAKVNSHTNSSPYSSYQE